MVIDLDTALAAGHELINICDGIVGMELATAPRERTPKPAGVLLMGRNPFCLDCVSARIMGLEGKVRLTELAASRGLCPEKESDAAVAGVRPDECRVRKFRAPRYRPCKKIPAYPSVPSAEAGNRQKNLPRMRNVREKLPSAHYLNEKR